MPFTTKRRHLHGLLSFLACFSHPCFASSIPAESGGVQPLFVGAAALLSAGHRSVLPVPVSWRVSGLHLSNSAAVVDLSRDGSPVLFVQWTTSRPSILTLDGAAGETYSMLLVPDGPVVLSAPQPVVSDSPVVADGQTKKLSSESPTTIPNAQREQPTKQARPTIFQDDKFRTSNIGLSAWDARWSNYGQYLQKLTESVQLQWERILIESRTVPTSGTYVAVVFRLNSNGAIARIVKVDGTAGSQAKHACTSALTSRSPYGAWTEDMIAVLGEEQEITFTFFYP